MIISLGRPLAFCARKGIKVPEDVAVTGHGDLGQFFSIAPGEITTMDTCLPEKAAKALELLLAMRDAREIEPNLRILFEPRLVLGRSTRRV